MVLCMGASHLGSSTLMPSPRVSAEAASSVRWEASSADPLLARLASTLHPDHEIGIDGAGDFPDVVL